MEVLEKILLEKTKGRLWLVSHPWLFLTYSSASLKKDGFVDEEIEYFIPLSRQIFPPF